MTSLKLNVDEIIKLDTIRYHRLLNDREEETGHSLLDG
jgi:hypothetical protein